MDKIDRRIEDTEAWLKEHAPECFDEQLHAVEGFSPERIYWHYGYLIALRDVRRLLAN